MMRDHEIRVELQEKNHKMAPEQKTSTKIYLHLLSGN